MRGKAFAACRATLKSRCSWASGGESCGCCQQSWRPLRQSRTRKLLQRPTCRSRLRRLRRHHSRTTEAGSISAATLDICGAAHGLKKTGWSPSRTRRRTASLAACWLVTTGKPALGSSALKETSAGPMHTGELDRSRAWAPWVRFQHLALLHRRWIRRSRFQLSRRRSYRANPVRREIQRMVDRWRC